jgi:hypothetical protein
LPNTYKSSSVYTTAGQVCRLGTFTHVPPFQDTTLSSIQPKVVEKQSFATFDNAIAQSDRLSKHSLRNLPAMNAAALDQLNRSMASRNICRHFMLRNCTAQNCHCAHDVIFRDMFMKTLFDDAWERVCALTQQDSIHRDLPTCGIARGVEIEGTLTPIGTSIVENQYKSDIILLGPPRTVSTDAGLYIPPLLPASHARDDINTEMDDEKSELQPGVVSVEVRRLDSSAESSSPLRSHGRHRESLHGLRHRVSAWGKNAWRRLA